MKKLLIVISFFVFGLIFLNAADPQQPVKQNSAQSPQLSEEEAFKQKINDLINKRRQISMSIYQTRVDLINTDPNLRVLHQAIIDLHEKMAGELNNNPKIVSLVDKGKEIDEEITKAIQDYQAKKTEGKQ
jgi:hypothetical protein